MIRHRKESLSYEINSLTQEAQKRGYILTYIDVFAIGYLCGKYDLKSLGKNPKATLKACREYDRTDDLGLFDTISETLIDLGVIKND